MKESHFVFLYTVGQFSNIIFQTVYIFLINLLGYW